MVCWRASSTSGPGSSEWLPRVVETILQQAQLTHGGGQEVDCLLKREKEEDYCGNEGSEEGERWCRATGGKMELWRWLPGRMVSPLRLLASPGFSRIRAKGLR